MARFSLSYVRHSLQVKEEDIEREDHALNRFDHLVENENVRYVCLFNHETSQYIREWFCFKVQRPLIYVDSNDTIRWEK